MTTFIHKSIKALKIMVGETDNMSYRAESVARKEP